MKELLDEKSGTCFFFSKKGCTLKAIGLEFGVLAADIDEILDPSINPEVLVQNLSYDKAFFVADKLKNNSIVIGADTVVLKNEILGKPCNKEHAFKMLKSLQGGWHEVLTGIAVIDSSDLKFKKGYEKTCVKMKPLSDNEIKAYIETGEPMDKAGGYGIQGKAAVFIERIEGDFFNVVGLPLFRLGKILENFGVSIFEKRFC
jgi:septum formation protein